MELKITISRVTLFFLSLFLSACLTRPPVSLAPAKIHVPNAEIVRMMTVSTRDVSADNSIVYTGERGKEIGFRFIEVSIPPNHIRGNIEWPRTELPNPNSEFSVVNSYNGDENTIPGWFRSLQSDGRLLIFVHGYNMHYSEAVFRLSQITFDLETKAAPVLFTWPSRGNVTSYLYDKSSAMYSRDALETLLMNASSSAEIKQITILAHSMGAWLTMEALRQSAIRNRDVDPKITDVILASPDIDQDVFSKQILALGDKRPHFTIVISSDDKALRLSRILAGGVTRIGATDLTNPENMKRIQDKVGLTVVDLSTIDGAGSLHHSKFSDSEESLDILASVIRPSDARTRTPTDPVQSVLIAISNALN